MTTDFQKSAEYFGFDTSEDDQCLYNEAVCDSFVHWVNMYKWMMVYYGEFYCPIDCPYGTDWNQFHQHIRMSEQIHETTDYSSCALCKKYNCFEGKGNCPLGKCTKNSLWGKVVFSKTKSEWLDNALKLIKRLFELRFYDEECDNE